MADGTIRFNQRETEASGLGLNETAIYSKTDGKMYEKPYGGSENEIITTALEWGVWKDWTPTFSAGGSMTYTSITLTHARYTVVGKTVTFNIKASGTTGGTASTYIAFTPPIVAAREHAFCGYLNDPSSFAVLSFFLNTNLIIVAKYDGANIGLGASRLFSLTGSYEIP